MKTELIPDAELLSVMQKDLHDFILEWGNRRGIEMTKFSIETVDKDTRKGKKYNTVFNGHKMFDRIFTVYTDLNKSYSRQDICNLACKIVRMFESNMKKDATNLAIFVKMYQKEGKDPIVAHKLAVKELMRMK